VEVKEIERERERWAFVAWHRRAVATWQCSCIAFGENYHVGNSSGKFSRLAIRMSHVLFFFFFFFLSFDPDLRI
jgi:hypothetical protein